MLTDGLEDTGSPLLVELTVRLVQGCLPGKAVNATNYQSYLRKLFKHKCQVSTHLVHIHTRFIHVEGRPLKTFWVYRYAEPLMKYCFYFDDMTNNDVFVKVVHVYNAVKVDGFYCIYVTDFHCLLTCFSV